MISTRPEKRTCRLAQRNVKHHTVENDRRDRKE